MGVLDGSNILFPLSLDISRYPGASFLIHCSTLRGIELLEHELDLILTHPVSIEDD